MASTVSGSDHSVRYDGVSMTMNIVYSNTKPFSGPQGRIAYEYHVSALWGAKSKSGQEIFTPFPNKARRVCHCGGGAGPRLLESHCAGCPENGTRPGRYQARGVTRWSVRRVQLQCAVSTAVHFCGDAGGCDSARRHSCDNVRVCWAWVVSVRTCGVLVPEAGWFAAWLVAGACHIVRHTSKPRLKSTNSGLTVSSFCW
mgnify:CR=1 FL=1